MPVSQSPAHYINSTKGSPSITESFPLVVFLVLCATVAALPVVQPHFNLWRGFVFQFNHCDARFPDIEKEGTS
jgi:hypothetical protein